MDPTAPNNNNQNPSPPNPVQPGQFVVAGDPQISPAQQTTAPVPQPDPPGPIPGMNLAQETPAVPPISPPTTPTQPDPTPFTPQQAAPTGNSGGGSKMKLILIIVVILVLIGAIAAVAYFFVLPKLNSSQTATGQNQTVIDLPSVAPQRTTGGFGQLPSQSTDSAQSTMSSQPVNGNGQPVPPTHP